VGVDLRVFQSRIVSEVPDACLSDRAGRMVPGDEPYSRRGGPSDGQDRLHGILRQCRRADPSVCALSVFEESCAARAMGFCSGATETGNSDCHAWFVSDLQGVLLSGTRGMRACRERAIRRQESFSQSVSPLLPGSSNRGGSADQESAIRY